MKLLKEVGLENVGLEIRTIFFFNQTPRTYGNGQVINTRQLSDLPNISERSTHDDGLVTKLLVIVEDTLNGGNSWVLLLGVCLSGLSLIPIKDTANEGRDKVCTSLGASNSLNLGEKKGEVDVDGMVALEDTSSLNTFPGGGDLDQDTGFVNANRLVELLNLLALFCFVLNFCRSSECCLPQ